VILIDRDIDREFEFIQSISDLEQIYWRICIDIERIHDSVYISNDLKKIFDNIRLFGFTINIASHM
jgi:hypothetical protein